jgi:hypothetical protein
VPDRYKSLVGVHILDTDAAELNDPRYRGLEGSITQTSDGITVGQCLERLKHGTGVNDWFPASQSTAVLYKPMPLGCSQYRAVSRLAMLDTMFADRFRQGLDAALQRTVQARGDTFSVAVRVMIVNSLAGGTGSGCFQQVALYVRDYFARHLNTQNVVVRGVALMPDVFVRNGDYNSTDLIDNVQANGYACLKEFDALTRARAGQFGLDAASLPVYPIELEYRPGQLQAAQVEAGPPPFNFMFLYDYTRSDGSNLGPKDNYIHQAAEALYLQLFSPLETNRGGIYSQEDNLLLTIVASQDRARLASSGVAKLIYPHEDIAEYCALQWATTGLSDDWLELDRLVDDEFRQGEQEKRQGIYRKMPERHVRYVELLRLKAEAENPLPFFSHVYRQAHLLDEDGGLLKTKSSEWLAAIQERIEEIFKVADAGARDALPTLNSEALLDKDEVAGLVEHHERGLDNYLDALTKATQPLANLVVKEALWSDYQQGKECVPDQAIRLNTWMLAKGNQTEAMAVHPVAVRFILGDVLMQLDDDLQKLETALDRLQKSVLGYKRRWDDPSTDEVETASLVARRHAQANWLVQTFQKPLQAFATDYVDQHNNQRQAIAKWSRVRVEHAVLSLLRQHVDGMLNDWQVFFRRLVDVQNNCRRDIDVLATKHETSVDPTRIHICASADDKAKLWENECLDMRIQEIPDEVARQLYLALYRRRARIHFDEAPGRVSGWEEALFRDHVVAWCRKGMLQHSGMDLDIKQAIDKELRHAQASGKRLDESADTAFRSYTEKLKNLAYPAIQVTGENFEFWCIDETVKRTIGNQLLLESIGQINEEGKDRKGGVRVDEVAYSKYELSFLRMTYGFSASDLKSMTDPYGVYRKAYETRLAKTRATPPESFTPHLDWRWDSPAFLPEVDDAAQTEAMRDLRRATLYNLLRQTPFYVANDDGVDRWEKVGPNGEREVLTGKDVVPVAATVEGLYLGLAVNYPLVEKILKQSLSEEAARKRDPDGLPLIKNLGAVLDQLLGMPAHASSQAEGEKIAAFMITTLCQEVIDMYGRCGDKPNAARSKAREKVEQALQDSDVMKHPSTHGVEESWSQHVQRQVGANFTP